MDEEAASVELLKAEDVEAEAWDGTFTTKTLQVNRTSNVPSHDTNLDEALDLMIAFAEPGVDAEAALVGVEEKKKWICASRDLREMPKFQGLQKYASMERLQAMNLYEMMSFLEDPTGKEHHQAEEPQKTKKTGYGHKASGAIGESGVTGESANASASANSNNGCGGNRTATSLTNLFDMFLTLVQKLGIWVYNLVPNLGVELPVFMASMSWLKFPSIGWELALELPDLNKRGWLYWVVLLGGIATPFYITWIILCDDGRQPRRDGVKEFTDADEFIIYESGRTKKISVAIVLAGVGLAIAGGMSDLGELLGFGCLVILCAGLYYAWERLKFYLLEMELSKHNRKLDSAYRGMRVTVCSTILLLALRSIYIMTLSALALTIRESSSMGEQIFCYIMLPFAFLVFPVFMYVQGRSFREDYISYLSPDVKNDPVKFRGWMERFALRETDATMKEVVIATFLLPFKPKEWLFAIAQLFERGFATLVAVYNADNIVGQLIAGLVIESIMGFNEITTFPFINNLEGIYNIAWRAIASLVLWICVAAELIGESFGSAADSLLLLVTLVALLLFLYAIDLRRIFQAIVRQGAISRFRKVIVEDSDDMLGDLGVHGPIKHLSENRLARTLQSAIFQIPFSVDPAEVFRDALSFVQQYRFLALADDDPEVLFLLLRHGLLTRVEPLLSLAGCKLGGHIPLSFGAFSHVQRLILSDMGLDDTSTLVPLSTLRNLEFLVLDRNNFKHRVQGLELLGKTTKLSSLSMRYCLAWEDDEEGSFYNKQLTQLLKLRVLDLQTEVNNLDLEVAPLAGERVRTRSLWSKAPIGYVFLQKLYTLEKFTEPSGHTTSPKYNMSSAGDIKHYSYDIAQYYRGGVPLSVMITEAQYSVRNSSQIKDLFLAGYSLEHLRKAGLKLEKVVDIFAIALRGGYPEEEKQPILDGFSLVNLKKAGYTVLECFKDGGFSLFELEKAKFSYLDMAKDLEARIADPPLNVTIFKLKDVGELKAFDHKAFHTAGFNSDDYRDSGLERSEFGFELADLLNWEEIMARKRVTGHKSREEPVLGKHNKDRKGWNGSSKF